MLQNVLSNYKTTIGGALTIALGIAALFGVKVGSNPIDPASAIAMITAGWGLLVAKDAAK